jgi:uncharacterized protein
MYYDYYSMDPTYILILAGALLAMMASAKLNSTYSRYSGVQASSGMTGAQVAQMILRSNNIFDVTVEPIEGKLTDNYDPSKKVLHLSQSVYGKSDIAAVGVAAHECGHALQHHTSYALLSLRSALVPVANIGAQISWPLFLIGLIMGGESLCRLGILAFGLAVLFQLVTLPVEYDASNRAQKQLAALGIIGDSEKKGVKAVLGAAALTYVAGTLSSLLQLLRLVMINKSSRRR